MEPASAFTKICIAVDNLQRAHHSDRPWQAAQADGGIQQSREDVSVLIIHAFTATRTVIAVSPPDTLNHLLLGACDNWRLDSPLQKAAGALERSCFFWG